ncbi:MAG: hypothetical protein HY774_28665 [Acidobacteria bacterium]|nr:hypothetical protein [Acidobacteriota bacterium]
MVPSVKKNNLQDDDFPSHTGSFNLPTPVNGRYPLTQDRYRSVFAPRQFQIGFRLRF